MLRLASKSPRRRELIATLGLPFTIVPANADETLPENIAPRDAVELLARKKCEAGRAGEGAEDITVGADTLVFLDGKPLGKPKDEEDALRMLLALSGRTHEVMTGVAVSRGGVTLSDVDVTAVTFRKYDEKEAKRYIRTGEPMDKAGAYGIQGKGGKLVDHYKGALDNVIGLPCTLLAALIDRLAKKEKMTAVTARLKEYYPNAACALESEGDGWRLLVMGRLSAQCTDARVNIVCKELFTKYPDCRSMAQADLDELCEAVRPCGLYRTKGENLRDASRMLLDRFDGRVPDNMEDLLSLPGVGRKIANLLLGDIYHKPAVVTDTHFIRICGRLGAYEETLTDPKKIEFLMIPLLDPAESADLCHRLVSFGRDVCTARSPKCGGCPLADLCAHRAAEH